MNEKKIINTVALVFVIAAVIARFVQSNDVDEFFSGFMLGIMLIFLWIIWAIDL